jgi:pilus assembly protein Flp/PilA
MLKVIINRVVSIFKEEKGQGMVEYALLVGLIAIVVIAVLIFLGPAIADKFQEIIDAL